MYTSNAVPNLNPPLFVVTKLCARNIMLSSTRSRLGDVTHAVDSELEKML